ncbi:uncharacterized protein LACBIDRAFT_309999 [Laccaria bicolor S238N-H82]|uniref:Predicted protein n=1 Tax=Laccaria bicolor (strain S238N-H82 / ATCC MYA-4686) TaxID=486041 RepID=B0DTF6_LACBS|nr:uncharacterized protein LACBIDRAFT_309999 [Laccaria bicolor S238N-H82]EDR02055.1 predicted protein [Laccaria bicolor S238N-H82]|eukprot:XP_001887212.1 predicted protein [Laccaria bicolor S238N-H82]
MTVFREGRATAGHPNSAPEMWTAFAHICWSKLLVDALCRPRPTLGILWLWQLYITRRSSHRWLKQRS